MNSLEQRTEERGHRWAVILFLITAGIIAYHNSFAGVFIFDGRDNILRNPMLDRLAEHAFTTERPLVYLTFALNYFLHGVRVWGYHFVNLVIHILSALALFGICRRTFLSPRLIDQFEKKSLWFALCISFLWLVHPLHTSSVTYIYQRAESLAGLFYLSTLYCAIRYLIFHRNMWFIFSILFCLCGMATKSVMVTVPIATFVYDRIFWGRSFREIFKKRKYFYAALISSWGFLGIVVRNDLGWFINEVPVSQVQYASNAPRAILYYLKLVFWPHPLVLDYQWPFNDFAYNFPFIIGVIVLMLLILRIFFRCAPLGFLGFWFFLILLPTSSIVPFEDIIFEHRMYLSLIAPIAGFVILSDYVINRSITSQTSRHSIAIVMILLIGTVFTALTVRRNTDYHDREKMWTDVIRHYPENLRAHYNLGVAYLEKGDKEKTMTHFLKAISGDKEYVRAHNNLGNLFYEQGNIEESVRHFEQALRIDPDYEGTYNNYGVVLMELNQFPKAQEYLIKASRLEPDNPEVFKNLGNFYYMQNRYGEALDFYTKAIALQPDNVTVLNTMGNLYFELENYDAALKKYFEVLNFRPQDPVVHNNLGSIYYRTGELENALLYFEQALRFSPGYQHARHNLDVLTALKNESNERSDPEDSLMIDFQGLSEQVFGGIE